MKCALRTGLIDDCSRCRVRQPNVKLVVNTWFAEVFGPNGKVDVAKLVRPGCSTDAASACWLLCLGVNSCSLVNEEIPRNVGSMNVQACAMVDVFQMAPSRRTVFASAGYSEVSLRAKMHNPSATGQEITRRCDPSPPRGGANTKRCEDQRDCNSP